MFKEKRMAYLEGEASGKARGSLESKMENDNLAYHYAIGILKTSGIDEVEAEAILNDDTNPFVIYLLSARNKIYRNSKDDLEKGKNLKTFIASKEYTRALNWQGLLLPGLKNILGRAGINYEMVKDKVSTLIQKKDVSTLIVLNNIEMGLRLDAYTLNSFTDQFKTKEMARRDAKNELNGLSAQVSEGVELPIEMKKRQVDAIKEALDNLPEVSKIPKIEKLDDETLREINQQVYGKYAGTMDDLNDLIKETEHAESISDEEYGVLNEELDGLISDVTEQNSDLQSFADQVNEVISVVEEMAASGEYTYSEIMAYLDSTDIRSQFDELSKSGADEDALKAVADLFEHKLMVIFDHYGIEMVGETITKEE